MKQYVTKFSWKTEKNKENALGIRNDDGVAFSVQWGDGVETQHVGDGGHLHLSHCYSEDGVATVTIEGPIKMLSLIYITALDVSHNVALIWLSCIKSQLTTLDVSQNVALTELHCGKNQLTTLDVSRNVALTKLCCENNFLTDLDISNNTALKRLSCGGNKFTTIDFSKNRALKNIRLARKLIK